MQSFFEFIEERQLLLNKSYPRYGHALILAGGAASGKGFNLSNVIGFQGKTFDVDEVKSQLARLAAIKPDTKYAKEFKAMFGYDLASYNSKNPQHVADMHEFVERLGIADKLKQNFIKSMQTRDHKNNLENVIFDVTLKSTKKLADIGSMLDDMGYPKNNRHIVWIVTPDSEAIKNNLQRARSVPEEILLKTHTGAAATMKEVISSPQYREYADGDIWVVFNSRNNKDTVLKGTVLEKYTAIKVKSAGKPAKTFKEIGQEYLDRIADYTPDASGW